jgi:hypothetical protein
MRDFVRLRKLHILATPAAALGAVLTLGVLSGAQEPGQGRLQEPVYRVTKATSQPVKAGETAAHPLDPALAMAYEGLDRIRQDVRDYSCTIAKRERVGDVLGDYEYMSAKIRTSSSPSRSKDAKSSSWKARTEAKCARTREA